MVYSIVIGIVVLAGGIFGYMNLPKFGRAAQGERLTRIEQSPNYRAGSFHNQEFTPQLTTDKSRVRVMFDFLFEKRENTRPEEPIKVVKTALKSLSSKDDLVVWFGHSSYYIQSSGLRILVDPVFDAAAPISFFNKPFAGTDIYTADDMPDVDYLIITHDHWDHLDHTTVVKLKDRVGKVICPLGVGAHFEYWGYAPNQIMEMDWAENAGLDNGAAIHCLPARHFSGRNFKMNQTLWASYMIQTPSQTIFLSGDGGYGGHFAQIAAQFPNIDLAIIENGQYNENWRHIHLMPEDVLKVIQELNPRRVIAGHNSKYALAKHPWNEPLDRVVSMAAQYSIPLLTPSIGEVSMLK